MLAEVCGNLVLLEEYCNVKMTGCNLSLILIYATIGSFATCFVILYIYGLMFLDFLSMFNYNLSIIMFVCCCRILVLGA